MQLLELNVVLWAHQPEHGRVAHRYFNRLEYPRQLVCSYRRKLNGRLNYRPNLDGATHLVEEISPLVLARCPSAQLKLVGYPDHEAQALERAA
jgi:hypothetical protein